MLTQFWLHVTRLRSSLSQDELGQTLAEYGLIMSVLAIAVLVLAVVAFRGTIIGAFTTAGTCISTAAANTGCGT